MACDTKVKLLLGVSLCLSLAGIVITIAAFALASDGVHVDWEAEATSAAILSAPVDEENTHCGWAIYFKKAEDCTSALAGVSVTPPEDAPSNIEPIQGLCSKSDLPENSIEYQGETLKLSFRIWVDHREGETDWVYDPGTYRITSSAADMWIMDYCGEFGEAMSGLAGAMGLLLAAVVLFILASMLCCVGCCCCG